MTKTPRLSLPLLAAGQAQKHVTHNDALVRLDALVHLTVDSRSQNAPPAAPTELSAYIVPPGASGAFADRTDQVALYEDGGWSFLQPRTGWQAWVSDEAEHHLWTGAEWRRATPASGLGAERWGINATADATNRLAVSSHASLFNHAGAGHQLKLNKASAGDTASLLFQTGFAGRAEFGLAGDDDLHLKVSTDGGSWREALIVSAATGVVSLPGSGWATATNLLVNGDFRINQRGFAGGPLMAGAYGFDRWRADAGGASLSLSGFDLALASGALLQVVEPGLWGLASFASVPLTLSIEEPSADIAVTIGSQSGAITAGTGRRSVTLIPAAGETGALAVRIAPASGPVSFRRAKLEIGPLATGWQARPLPAEQRLCARYFWKRQGSFVLDGYQVAGATLRQGLTLPVPMRATPAVSFGVSQEINVQGSDRGVVAQSPETADTFVTALALGRVRVAFDSIAFDAEL